MGPSSLGGPQEVIARRRLPFVAPVTIAGRPTVIKHLVSAACRASTGLLHELVTVGRLLGWRSITGHAFNEVAIIRIDGPIPQERAVRPYAKPRQRVLPRLRR
jgi:hypothetical protein